MDERLSFIRSPRQKSAYLTDFLAASAATNALFKDVQSIGCQLGNDFQIRCPHVAADILELGAALFTKLTKEAEQHFYPAFRALLWS